MVEMHRQIAAHCSSTAWRLIELQERTQAETIQMLHAAHAACYHITQVGAPVHVARCEWLLSRACVLAGMDEAALLHAEYALEIAQTTRDDATRALCLEGCARAHAALGEPVSASYSKQEAYLALLIVEDEADKEYIARELQSLPD
jgi:hypothetical protein